MVVGDLDKHPTMSPQSFQSKVHRRCNLLLCAGWSSGSKRGLGWEDSVVRCLLIRSWMTVWTYGMSRSVWSVWLVTYQGALVMVRRSLDWYLCILTLDAGLPARSQYPQGPPTGHLDTGFSWFPCVYKRMLRWFPRFQIATTCFSCSPPDLNFLVTFFLYIHVFVYM